MIDKSSETTISGTVVNIDNIDVKIDVAIDIKIVVVLFMFVLFFIVKNKVKVSKLPKILKLLDILRTIFSKVIRLFSFKASLQVLNLGKIKRTLLLAGLCVLFIIVLFR